MRGEEGDGVGMFLNRKIRPFWATHIIPDYSMPTHCILIHLLRCPDAHCLDHLVQLRGDARGLGICPHAPGVEAPIAVERPLVILRRGHEPRGQNCNTWPWVCRDVGGNPSQMPGWEEGRLTTGESAREREG